MSTEFVWTDELVLKYARDFSFGCEANLNKFKLENTKEQKKDWEIVEYYPSLPGRTPDIMSVRRLSDGVVFSVGDYVSGGRNLYDKFTIDSFDIVDGYLFARKVRRPFSTKGDGYEIGMLTKIAEKQKPLFTTEQIEMVSTKIKDVLSGMI